MEEMNLYDNIGDEEEKQSIKMKNGRKNAKKRRNQVCVFKKNFAVIY